MKRNDKIFHYEGLN
ncbi:TPA: hypothetical protein OCX78_001614 [Escherichia coli]|nr:hypothetical protein [Escherichia coli]HCP1507777.1 hypothetical protein [Escherichia coli]HCP1665354.1 hypothetical protein [Escherichia coli]HCP1805822.1 hypothetical protein [Escherichia coli]